MRRAEPTRGRGSPQRGFDLARGSRSWTGWYHVCWWLVPKFGPAVGSRSFFKIPKSATPVALSGSLSYLADHPDPSSKMAPVPEPPPTSARAGRISGHAGVGRKLEVVGDAFGAQERGGQDGGQEKRTEPPIDGTAEQLPSSNEILTRIFLKPAPPSHAGPPRLC